MNRSQLAAFIDHTLLKPESTDADVARLCQVANEFHVAAVCVSPSRLPLAARLVDAGIAIATVCGFPSGNHRPEAKGFEASLSVELGANEVDMVIDLGQVKAGDWSAVAADVEAVRNAVKTPNLVKVIIESGALTKEEIVTICKVCESSGADYVKTSTGFHPSGGASIEAVALMADTVGGRLGIKASGGIRDATAALAMVDVGATRIGTSSTALILSEVSE